MNAFTGSLTIRFYYLMIENKDDRNTNNHKSWYYIIFRSDHIMTFLNSVRVAKFTYYTYTYSGVYIGRGFVVGIAQHTDYAHLMMKNITFSQDADVNRVSVRNGIFN